MASQPSVMDLYARDVQRYDELLATDGTVRPHWRALIEKLDSNGSEAARRSADLAQRLIIENGVTYNVYADPQGRDRPWGLDTLPLILPAGEWSTIEAGIVQRARLLDALLDDLYGPQRLFSEGTLPPEIAFGHPNFLWPCLHAMPPGSRRLYLYAADLARAPDGRWWVLGDRTQTPSGLGYALENRRIIAQVLPELLNDLDVRALGSSLGALREELLNSVQEDEAPLAVVLTPGPYNETYFEHAYLAGQLGFQLVEGNDLTVRGNTLYLKTPHGLRRVHTVLRRLDDDFCDPAELRSDSALGVPGLLQVVRAGRVVLANALGTGVLESAVWQGFLPSAAMRLLGEELQLPAVATWWCGERAALDQVLENLEHLVIKPTFPNQRFEPVFGRELTRDARAQLIRRLRARPYAYVAQERISLSQIPVWKDAGLAGRALAVRVYAMATKDGYQVLPGGLARIASDSQADIVSHQRGGSSKDVWILPAASALDTAETGLCSPPSRVRGRPTLPHGRVAPALETAFLAQPGPARARPLEQRLVSQTAVHYRVRHQTRYEYSTEVVHSHHLLHLAPRAMPHQRCSVQQLSVEPTPSVSTEGIDAFGNPITRLEFDRPHQVLCVTSLLELEVQQRGVPAHATSEHWEYTRKQLAYAGGVPSPEILEACRYRNESPHVRIKQAFNDYSAECFPARRPVLAAAEALMHKLYEEMTYSPGATGIATPLLEVLATQRGVCQDYAHLMIACVRSRGLAARYVSGYLRTVPRPRTERQVDSLIGADASHAWVAVYCPPLGWVEFDPTNGVRAGLDHIVLAWGRDFGDVSPLRGVIVGGGQHQLAVSVAVEPQRTTAA